MLANVIGMMSKFNYSNFFFVWNNRELEFKLNLERKDIEDRVVDAITELRPVYLFLFKIF
jgi:hypothetical protein